MIDKVRKRAEEAAAALENETLMECFSALDASFLRSWRKGDTVEAREAAYYCQSVLSEIRGWLFERLDMMAIREARDGNRENIWREKRQQLRKEEEA